MLVAAGILFVIALLLIFIDKTVGSEDLNLATPIRLLLISAAIIIGIHTYQKNKGPETAVAQEEVQGDSPESRKSYCLALLLCEGASLRSTSGAVMLSFLEGVKQ